MTIEEAAILHITQKHTLPADAVVKAIQCWLTEYGNKVYPKLTDYTVNDIAALYLSYLAGVAHGIECDEAWKR